MTIKHGQNLNLTTENRPRSQTEENFINIFQNEQIEDINSRNLQKTSSLSKINSQKLKSPFKTIKNENTNIWFSRTIAAKRLSTLQEEQEFDNDADAKKFRQKADANLK